MKLLKVLLVGLATVALMAGCDVSSSDTDEGSLPPTDPGQTDPGQTDEGPPPPPEYYAIIVDEDVPSCSNSGAHGADIDAVQIMDSAGLHVAWVSFVGGDTPATDCEDKGPNQFTDQSKVVGASDMGFTEGFVSLNGGHVVVEFDGGIQLVQDHTVTVYEAGSQTSSGGITGKDEPYDVYAATNMGDCAAPGTSCSILVGNGLGEADVPLGNAPI